MDEFDKQVKCDKCGMLMSINTRYINHCFCQKCGNRIQLETKSINLSKEPDNTGEIYPNRQSNNTSTVYTNSNQTNVNVTKQPEDVQEPGILDKVAIALAVFSLFCCGGVFLSIPAVVLAIMAINDKTGKYPNKELAKVALVLGAFGVLASLVTFGFCLFSAIYEVITTA